MQDDLVELFELIESVYTSTLSTGRWEDFLRNLRRFSGSDGVALVSYNLRSGETHGIWPDYDPAETEQFAKYYARISPWMPREETLKRIDREGGNVVRSEEVVPLALLKRSEFFQDWAKKNNAVFSLAANLGVTDNTIQYIALSRAENHGPYPDRVVRSLARLIPHVRNALRFQQQMGTAGMVKRLVESLSIPIYLLDRHGDIVQRIAGLGTAEHFVGLDASTVRLPLVTYQGRSLADEIVCFTTSLEPTRILRLIDRRTGLEYGGILYRCDQPVLSRTQECYFLGLIRSGMAAAESLERACLVYGLTPAETRLVRSLTAHGSLESAIDQLKITRNTARTQMASIFSKTGVNRQGQLIAHFSLLGCFTHLGDDSLTNTA